MLTVFSTPKPFQGHIGVIQVNAIRSWLRVAPGAEVILFGDEPGSAEVCERLNLRHVPDVIRNEWGTPLLDDMFARAQALASHDLLCYANADIILLEDLRKALEVATRWRERYLLVGRRCDLDITGSLDFDDPDCEDRLRTWARTAGKHRPAEWIDYFLFPKGTFPEFLPFAVGRAGWDNWLLWKARSQGIPLIDATAQVLAIHQNHDYAHLAGGQAGVWNGVEAEQNHRLIGSWVRMYTIADSNYRLAEKAIERNLGREYLGRRLEMARRRLIEWSRPVRHRFGFRGATPAGQTSAESEVS